MNLFQGVTLRAAVALILALGWVAMAEGQSTGKVNINTADTEKLALLPRVGPSVAGRIVQFRDENGKFSAVEDLMLVRGIGEKTFELIEPYVKIDGETDLREKVSASRGDGPSKSEPDGD